MCCIKQNSSPHFINEALKLCSISHGELPMFFLGLQQRERGRNTLASPFFLHPSLSPRSYVSQTSMNGVMGENRKSCLHPEQRAEEVLVLMANRSSCGTENLSMNVCTCVNVHLQRSFQKSIYMEECQAHFRVGGLKQF